jgi:hypothetical protein
VLSAGTLLYPCSNCGQLKNLLIEVTGWSNGQLENLQFEVTERSHAQLKNVGFEVTG